MKFEQVAARLTRYEGQAAWPYLNHAGSMFAGVGHRILDADACAALPWEPVEDARREFRLLARATVGLSRSAYELLTGLRLSPENIKTLLAKDIAQVSEALDEALPWWREIPEPAQQAVFDYGWDCGVDGLLNMRRLIAALRANDWSQAAEVSDRGGRSRSEAGTKRNVEIRFLLQGCVTSR